MELEKRDYRNFSAEDFALDASFLKWVLNPDEETDRSWKDFQRSNPYLEGAISEAKELIRMGGLSTSPEANKAFLDTWQKLQANAVKPARTASPVYARLAAVLIGMVVMVTYLVWNGRKTADLPEFQTAFGEIREVVLKDGSKVTLNSNSTLKYVSAFEGDREVLLNGEAFFDVSHTADGRKFIVHTQDPVDIEVLGTEFNVNTRRDKIAVFLQSGKVSVHSGTSRVTLSPGEQAHYNRSSRQLAVTKESKPVAEGVLGWTSKFFIYNDTSLSAIAAEIEDYYGVPVSLTDPALGERKFTGKIPRQHVEVLLKVLSETLEIVIERKDDKIVIRSMS